MTPDQALQAIHKLEGRSEYLKERRESLERKCSKLTKSVGHHEKVEAGYTLLSDSQVGDFCKALESVANQVIGKAFGAQRVFFDVVGKSGFRLCVEDGKLIDSIADSQGEGFVHVVSIALLLGALSISPRTGADFLLLDEPFSGALHEDRLRMVYGWLAEASRDLGIQVIATTHHEEAIECADNTVLIGEGL